MSEGEILKAYNDGINSVIELVKVLTQTINELNNKISTLEERVQFILVIPIFVIPKTNKRSLRPA